MTAPACPYCDAEAYLVDGSFVYPHLPELRMKPFWYCDNGHGRAFVGCHPGTIKPLGSPAKKGLRQMRAKCHRLFDALWRDRSNRRFKSRRKAYSWLANAMNLPPEKAHIGMFTEDQCRQLIEILAREP